VDGRRLGTYNALAMKPFMILCDVGRSNPSFPMHLTVSSACGDDSILVVSIEHCIRSSATTPLDNLHTSSPLTVQSTSYCASSSHIYHKAMGTPDKYFWTPKSDIKIEEYVKKVSSILFSPWHGLTNSSAPR
jgi:hypothetical protein